MKQDVIQASFSTGELGASLKGRTDIVQYNNACDIVENFIPRSYGSLISASGTTYVATTSDSSLKSRLIKFVFNREDAYVIETGDLYFRFFTNQGQVTTLTGTEDLSSISSGTLVAHWKMNDNTNSTLVTDETGSHSGTLSTLTSSVSTASLINTGFNFAGLYHVEVAGESAFTFTDTTGGNPFSLIAWVYYKNTGNFQRIICKLSPNEWQFIFKPTGNLLFQTFSRTTGGPVISALIETNQGLSEGWHFVVSTYDGRGGSDAINGMNLYIDGVLQTDVTRTDQGYEYMTSGGAAVTIGRGGSPLYYFADKMDNVAVVSGELTQAEVSALYSSSAYQLTAPYFESELSDIKYAQLNDVIWLAHKNHHPQQLTRTSANEWTITDFPFKGGPFLDDNTPPLSPTAGVTYSTVTITPSATAGTINITVSPTNANLFTRSGTTLGHHNSYWMIGGLSQTSSTTELEEVGYVKITNVVNSYTATATVIKNLKSTAATTEWAEGAWSAVRGYPAAVALHERRLFWARTNQEPQKVWGSKTYVYDDYALDTQAADDGLNLALASNESNEIQWLASGKSLIAGTFGGAFVINSGSSEAITPDNVQASDEVGYGTSSIQPKKIGSFLYYIQRFGKKLRELFYNFDTDTYKAVDRTILNPDVLGDGAIDIDFSTNPENILYCVTTGGTLATMTREVDQDVTGWARHTTDGTYSSVAIIPSQSGLYDEVWVIVERWINGSQKKYIEIFDNIEVPTRQEDCNYLHSSLKYNAFMTDSTSTITLSLSGTGGTVTVTSSGNTFTSGQIGYRLRAIDEFGDTVGEGRIATYTSATVVNIAVTYNFTSTSLAINRWGISVDTLSGLSHLEAKTIKVLADGGNDSGTKTVASGAITLTDNYFKVTAGLPYDQIVKTLPKEAGSQRGTAVGKKQRISRTSIKLNRSHKGFYLGGSEEDLDVVSYIDTTTTEILYTGTIPNSEFKLERVSFRDPSAPMGTPDVLFTGIIPDIRIRNNYKYGSFLYLKNSDPLPMEILSIVTELETYEK